MTQLGGWVAGAHVAAAILLCSTRKANIGRGPGAGWRASPGGGEGAGGVDWVPATVRKESAMLATRSYTRPFKEGPGFAIGQLPPAAACRPPC